MLTEQGKAVWDSAVDKAVENLSIAVGDYVTIHGNALSWRVLKIEDYIEPLGVLLESGQTGRLRRESYAALRPWKERE